MRSRGALAAAVLAIGILAAASLGEAQTRHAGKPKPTCVRRHHRRTCTTHHPKAHHRSTTTTTSTSTSTRSTSSTSSATSTTTVAQTTATQSTSTPQTTTTTSTTAPPLPHGTEVDELATGLGSPFYAMDANEQTLAAGSLHFNVYNYDQDPHTFAVADSTGHQISATVQVPAGRTNTQVTLNVNLLPGTYVLFCTLPQHAGLGMKTTIVVR